MAKRRRGEDRKEALFKAILRIVAREGMAGVTTTGVAKELGVTQPALYKHFKNKEEMILHFVRQLKEVLSSILDEARKGSTTRERLSLLYEKHFQFIQSTGVIPRVIFSDTILSGERNREALQEALTGYREGIVALLKEGVERGEIRPLDFDTAARFLLGSILTGALFWLLEGGQGSLVAERERLLDFFYDWMKSEGG